LETSSRITVHAYSEIDRVEGDNSLRGVTFFNRRTGKSVARPIENLFVMMGAEPNYRLVKEFWGFRENRMAVRFCYESHDASGQWFRSYSNELGESDENGLMIFRHASINDLAIPEAERLFHWPTGRRPDDHPGLRDLDL